MEESSTRAARPRRVVDLVAVLMGRPSTTSMAPPAQHLVELYGLLPTVADAAAGTLFLLSRRSQPAGRDWPVPRTVWAEPIAESITRLSKAFTTFYVEDRVRTRRLAGGWTRWAAG